MPIDYIDSIQNIIFETWTGPIDAADLESYWTSYMADEKVMALRRTVVDLRPADIRFNASELLDLVTRVVAPRLSGRDWRTALIVDDPVQFGISRQ